MRIRTEGRITLSAGTIVSLYAIVSSAYILFSDKLLTWMTRDLERVAELQSIKGLGFVFITAGLLYWLIRLYSRSLTQAERLQRETAETLRKEQLKLQSVIASMGDGLVCVTPDGAFQMVNPTASLLLGVPGLPPPLPEWPERLHMHAEDKRRLLRPEEHALARALAGETVMRQDVYMGGEREVRWLSISAQPVIDNGGTVGGAVAVIRDATERIETNEALQENRRRLFTLLSNLPGMAYRCRNDRQWTMDFVSEGASMLTGYAPESLMRNDPSYGSLIHSDDEGTVWNEVQQAVAVREPFHMMYRIGTASGEERWVFEQGRGIFDEERRLQAVEGFIFDITDRKLAEDKLAESEARFRSLIENASDVITLLDRRGIVVYQSPSVERVLGYGPDAMVGRPGLDFVCEEDRQRVRRMFRNAVGHPGEAWPAEFRIQRADGTWREVESLNQLYSANAQDLIIVSNIRDVTERKEAEAENRRLASAVDQVAEAIVICDSQGLIGYVNDAALRMTEYERDEVLNHAAPMLLMADDENVGSMELPPMFGKAQVWNGRMLGRRKSGVSFPCDVTFSPMRNEQGDLLHVVLVLRDMTRVVRLEAQVRQQQKLEAIGTLAGGIAHDFNNILSAIMGYTEMALLGLTEDPATVTHDLEQVMKAGQRARDLVRQILTFSRKTEVGRAPVKTDLILDEALQLLKATLPSNIVVESNIDRNCEPVLLDPTHLHQVVMNLCINSYHAMRDGGGTLTVVSKQVTLDEVSASEYLELTAGAYVVVVVRDTGHGMDRDVMEHIFEPFFTTKGEHEGTGLGLSTAYGVVKEAGGSIVAYSEPGRGTSMQIYLPVHHEQLAPEVSVRTITGQGRGELILIVDDEPTIAMVAGKMLQRLGYKVETYTDSRKALAAFRMQPHHYALIFTDYSMPEMNGIEFATEARRISEETPILLASGFHEAFTNRDAASLPVTDVIAKPFDYRSLAAAVGQAIPRASSLANRPT